MSIDVSVQKSSLLLRHSSFLLRTSPATAPGIVLFLNRDKPKTRQGKVFLANASEVSEKGDPKNSIAPAGNDRSSGE